MARELLFAPGLVAANGFIVASEFAIARLRPTQGAEFVRQGRPGASGLHSHGAATALHANGRPLTA